MKHTKHLAALTAAVTALTPIAAGIQGFAPAAVLAADSKAAVPAWVPDSHSAAVDFFNTYGTTHIEDGLICIVHDSGNPQFSPLLEVNGVYAERDIGCISYRTYERIPGADDSPYFIVMVYAPTKSGALTISFKNAETQTDYTFENGADGITETDIYGWLPDCTEEFRTYSRSHFIYSVKDNYVVFCHTQNPQTGLEWVQTSSGSPCFERAAVSDCPPLFQPDQDDDEEMQYVYAYKAISDGYASIRFDTYDMLVTDGGIGEAYTADCVVYNNAQTVLLSGQMRVTLEDIDTGALIPLSEDQYASMWTDISYNTPNGPVSTGPILMLESNPSVQENIGGHFDAASFSFGMDRSQLPAGYTFPAGTNDHEFGYFSGTVKPEDYVSVTRFDNGSADVVLRLKKQQDAPTGDLNGDGAFGVADAVLLRRYLCGERNVRLPDWTAADYNGDGRLNAADLTLMKRTLIQNRLHICAEPTNKVEFGELFYVLADGSKGLNMYLGPDESTAVIAALPDGTPLRERGFMEGNADWLFTEYEGQHGWIRIREADGTLNVFYDAVVDKPVIYLYPEEETDVQVTLTLTESELATTYPRYNGGWNVTAYPDGTLLNKPDGTHHRYLFWDAKNVRTRFDFSEGFCVAGSDTEQFLKETLTEMGLTESEMNEFIVYWLPRMEHNAFNLIAFQGKAYTDSAQLSITPQPDSLLRVFMAYVPLDSAVEIAPQTIEPFTRTGFTAVEWGGCEVCAQP